MLGLLLDLLLSFTPLGKILDEGLSLIWKAVAAIIWRQIVSVAVLLRRDEHTYDTEKWLDDLLFSKTLDDDEADEIIGPAPRVEKKHDQSVAYDEDETGDEEYLQYGHVDDMD